LTNKKPLPAIGKIIKMKLMDINMTQSELAEALDMDNKYLTEIIRGRKGIRGSKYYDRIYKFLDINQDELKRIS